MRRADDVRLRLGKQNRTAIGRAHADGEARRPRDDAVGARARVERPRRLGDDDMRRVDLVGGEQTARLDAERGGHARAILGDIGGTVMRADAAIEARIESAGNSALAREKRMAYAGERQRLGLDHHDVSNPGRESSCGSAMAMALHNSPIPFAPPAVRRESAWSISTVLP